MRLICFFISAVTEEFKSYRDALRKDLDRPNVTVKIQEDFVSWGTPTLQKLDHYIRRCAAVIHLIGDRTGAFVDSSDILAFLSANPEFRERFPTISNIYSLDRSPISYTQFEAYLAIYREKPLIIATPSSTNPDIAGKYAPPAEFDLQKAHLARLASLGRYPEVVFDSSDRLSIEVLRSQIHDILQRPETIRPSTIAKEVTAFLNSVTVPYQVIDSQSQFTIYRIIDPTSIFSNEFILIVLDSIVENRYVDTLVKIAQSGNAFTNIVMVVETLPTREISQYVAARGVVIKTIAEFRAEFSKLAPRERFYVGALAAVGLCETLNVDKCFVDPDAAPVRPGDHMESSYLKTRIKAVDLVVDFIGSDDKILFVLGGYGSGKSAFCADILRKSEVLEECTPVYYPLRQLETASELGRVIGKCRQLGELYAGAKGTSLVILDGLDEISNAMNPDQKRMNMLRILEGAAAAEKIIITSRASYFRGLDDFWRLFNRKGEDSLWRDIARLMPTSGTYPKVSAIALREFDSDQILDFVEKFATEESTTHTLRSEASRILANRGDGPNYMMLARNPLYLYLLLGSRPWNNSNIKCVANVYGVFIRYWLERDIEKGKSRWNLTTDDRFDFMYYVAFFMFVGRRHALHFDEFDKLVQKFFGHRLKQTELQTLALDLQTTGAFGSIGNHIHFAVPAFSDYLIALRFSCGDFKMDEDIGEIPARMPTIDQVIMWAGLAETEKKGIDYQLALLSMNKINLTSDLKQWILFDANLTLYVPPGEYAVFTYLNSDAPGAVGVRIVANSVVLSAAAGSESRIRVKIKNRKGMHARAVAKLVQAYEIWLEELASRWEKPVLWMSREGPGEERSVLGSIMGLLTLGGGQGTIFVITFENCNIAEVETLLERLHSRRPTPSKDYWELTFGEDEF